MSSFVDANVFLRLLARDAPAKTTDCFALFQSALRGQVELHTSEAIVAEVVYVLTSPKLYGRSRAETASGLRPVIEIRGLRLDHKDSVLAAIDRWEHTRVLDFDDCLATAHALRHHEGSLYSYDRDIGRVDGIQRIEPPPAST